MSEDSIRDAEEKLHKLIDESNLVLTEIKGQSARIFTKLRKTINTLIAIGAGVVITFLLSYVDIRERMATLEEATFSKKEAAIMTEKNDSKYATKVGVILLHNDIYDMNKMYFESKKDATEQRMEKSYTGALKAFNGDITRSLN